MKVNLSKALTVDGKEYFAGEQFVEDGVGEKLRGQDGVTFPDGGNDSAPAFDFPKSAIGSEAKKMAGEMEKYIGATTSHTSADKKTEPPKAPAPKEQKVNV